MKKNSYAGLAVIIMLFGTCAWSATYYVASNGIDSNPGTETLPWLHIQHAADTLLAGDIVYVKAGTYHEKVTPQNSGTPAAYITYAAYPGQTVTIDGSGVTLPAWGGGLFDIQMVDYIRVSGFRIMNAGPNLDNAGILLYTANHIVIENNYIYNTVSSGIGVWNSSYVKVSGNEVQLCCNDGEQECISIDGSNNFEIRNNHVHHGGPGNNGGEGIDVKDGSNNGSVFGNHIHHMNRVGLYFDAWDKHTYNITAYRNNIHDNADGIAIASEMAGLLEYVSVYNNIVYNNVYRGLVFGEWGGPVTSHPTTNIKITNNTFYGNGVTWGGGISVDNPDAQNIDIRNNITSQNTSFTIVVNVPVTNLVIAYNLIDGFQNEPGETRGTNYVEGNPLFVNPSGSDFHLQLNSPAIDSGSSINAPATDYDVNLRPMGLGYEMGAFEYITPTPDISLEQETTSFGITAVNNPVTNGITVRNVGTANLTINSTTNPSAPFSITSNGCTGQILSPGGSCVILLQFLPTIAGYFQNSFTISSNDPDEASAIAGLHGSGVLNLMSAIQIILPNDATGLWEPGETVIIAASWHNDSANPATSVTGTVTANSTLVALDTNASYGNMPAGATVSCTTTGNCYGGTAVGPRPSTHWDVTLTEVLSVYHHKDWLLHIGSSFNDVALSSIFYKYIETLLHSGVTGGCNASSYCPSNIVARAQMAKFICASMEKKNPGSCTAGSCAGTFTDVPSSNIFCPYIEALYSAGIVSGCQASPLMYCPSSNTQRQAMAKFICLGMEDAMPGSCIITSCAGTFTDVTSSNVFCPYIEALYTNNIISGCLSSPLMYCPSNNVSREQMSKFLVNAFEFTL